MGERLQQSGAVTGLRVAVGLLIVTFTFASLVGTFVMPRGKSFGLRTALLVMRTARLLGVAIARPFRGFSQKDAILAAVGPFALLAQLAAFLTLLVLGYSIALWPYATSYPDALKLAAAEVFSAGIARVSGPGNAALQDLGAVTGGVAIALQIGYLPAIYQAFNRRESLVTLLESRAGLPAWGPELLMRHQLIASLDGLPQLYRDWELWSADLAETHVSYPILLVFRSPQPGYSYVLALLTVLDAAALHLSLMPSTAPHEARFCLRMGFTALRRIGETLDWSVDYDPLPDAELQLTYEEFAHAVDLLVQVGVPTERTAEEAWPHFRGWRVNYEAVAYRLADRIVAPPAPWSGERRHLAADVMRPLRPAHREPGGKMTDRSTLLPPG